MIIKKNKHNFQTLTDVLTDEERAVFKTAYEINQFKHIDLCAQRQKYIDQAQSINVFIANMEAKDIMRLYLYAAAGSPNFSSMLSHPPNVPEWFVNGSTNNLYCVRSEKFVFG